MSAAHGASGASARKAASPSSPIGARARKRSAPSSRTRRSNSPSARHALADEYDKAEAARKEAADARAEGEVALSDGDRVARQALEAMGVAREQRAASEERVEGARLRGEQLHARDAGRA